MEKLEIGIETELGNLPEVTPPINEVSITKKYPKKNKWTKSKVGECKRRINDEIYCRKSKLHYKSN